jgi:hypothetical protein
LSFLFHRETQKTKQILPALLNAQPIYLGYIVADPPPLKLWRDKTARQACRHNGCHALRAHQKPFLPISAQS